MDRWSYDDVSGYEVAGIHTAHRRVYTATMIPIIYSNLLSNQTISWGIKLTTKLIMGTCFKVYHNVPTLAFVHGWAVCSNPVGSVCSPWCDVD